MTVHASRLKRTMPFLAVLLVVWLVAPAAAVGAAAPAQPTRKVTVDQTTQLVNQVVRVTWSGFKPSSDAMLSSSTTYVVRVYQCRGKNPTAVTDCYSATGFTYPGKTKDGLPTPDGPTNAVTTTTRPNGTGTADIEVRTTRESTNLGCDSSHPCSLVVIPNDGDPARPDLDFQLANQDNMDQPWAWARRVVVPLNFAPTSLACGLKNPDAASSGSPGILRLIQQWQPKLCRLSKPVDVDYTQVGEPTARTSFGLKTTDLALTTRPDDTTPTRPYTYAPISVSGIAIAYRLDDRDTGQPITDLKLTPRLVAKLITESYAMSAFCRTPKDTTCNGATRDNPVDIFQDPEFLKLNGTAHSWPNSSWPTLVSGENDLTYELTRWLAADGDTQRFLAGKKGKKGDVHVNTHFKGIKYPVSSFESRDNDPSFVHGYIPILGLSEVAHLLVTNRSNSEDYKKDATGNYPKSPPSTVGTRGLIAIVSNADAAALRFPTARLRNAAGKYVAATDAGITAALGQLKTNKDKITQSMNYGGKAAKAYPLTTVQYAQVPTNGVGSTKAEKIARFLDYAAGPGQVRGVAPGQLPAGYVPLTTAMRTQTKKAAAEVRAQKGTLPTTPAPAGPKPSNNTTPSPNQPNLPTTTNPGGVKLPLVAGPAPMGGRLSGNVSTLVQWLLPVLLAAGVGGALLGPILYGSGAFLDPGGLARRPPPTGPPPTGPPPPPPPRSPALTPTPSAEPSAGPSAAPFAAVVGRAARRGRRRRR
ncbi:MAG: hypothetical protein JWN52_5460 [Actinomycetia bacterium]|nr:hypothetical protein [Actinomycetes bacterium]